MVGVKSNPAIRVKLPPPLLLDKSMVLMPVPLMLPAEIMLRFIPLNTRSDGKVMPVPASELAMVPDDVGGANTNGLPFMLPVPLRVKSGLRTVSVSLPVTVTPVSTITDCPLP